MVKNYLEVENKYIEQFVMDNNDENMNEYELEQFIIVRVVAIKVRQLSFLEGFREYFIEEYY